MKQEYTVIIDDEKNIRLTLSGLLNDEGYNARAFPNTSSALEFIMKNPVCIVLLDIWLQDGIDGVQALEQIKKIDDSIQVIMMSGHGTIDLAVQCIKQGAYDFLEKPLSAERIFIVIKNALKLKQLHGENQIFKSIMQDHEKILGSSRSIMEIKDQIMKIAKTNASVLISGENGTGKELVARSIHDLSDRSDKAFVSINCAAVPNTLFESEFFGYEKGAFTGAERKKIGKIEMADKGTLFLDEIGDMDITSQSKILKVIENKEFMRLGGLKNIIADIRFISATNQNLENMVKKSQFREDLYFRLNVIPVNLPALRERKEDIPYLVDHFIKKFSNEHKKRDMTIDAKAMERMSLYAWPGNVRELKNYIERIVIFTDKDIIRENDLLAPVVSQQGFNLLSTDKSLKEAKEDFERYYIKKILDITNGNVSKASGILSLDRTSLHRKIRALNLINNS